MFIFSMHTHLFQKINLKVRVRCNKRIVSINKTTCHSKGCKIRMTSNTSNALPGCLLGSVRTAQLLSG